MSGKAQMTKEDRLQFYFAFNYWLVNYFSTLTDGPATINVNIYLRTISRIDDVKMVRNYRRDHAIARHPFI